MKNLLMDVWWAISLAIGITIARYREWRSWKETRRG